MARLAKHPRLKRGILIALALIGCGFFWMLAALFMLSFIPPASHFPM